MLLVSIVKNLTTALKLQQLSSVSKERKKNGIKGVPIYQK